MTKAPEGVAAPLEPSEFAHNWAMSHEGVEQRLDWRIFELMKAYAAAVSKNLQEELAQLKEDLRCESFNCECYETRIEQLEKEIAALRETK